MPVKKCTRDGKSGYKYGDEGTCYTGAGSEEKAKQQGRAIEASKAKNEGDKMKILNVNLKGFTKNVTTRTEMLHGIEHIVAPVVMIVEGVLPGSYGPILYTANEIEASVSYWDNIPVTINHPTDSEGNNVSARIPAIIEQFGVGQIYNTHFDPTTKSLKAEAWLNKNLLETKFPVVYAAILDDNMNMEVSTGVFFDDRGEAGDFNGISYNSTAYGYHGDHLALLPNATGACSWKDGCGIRANKSSIAKERKSVFNEISFGDISSALWRYIDSFDDNTYIYYTDAIYENYFTFERIERNQERKRTLWKQSYSKMNDLITPTGEPQRVMETRVYTVVSEDSAQTSGTPTITNTKKTKKESDMADDKPCCPEKVKSLIAAKTNAFTEADEDFLLTLNEKQLESTVAMSENLLAANSIKTEDTGGEELQTLEDFVEKSPEHIKAKLNALLAKEKEDLEKEEAKKAEIIENILKDEDCTFEKADLEGFTVNMLSKIAGLSKKEESTDQTSTVADMTANAGTQTVAKVPGTNDTLRPEETLVPITVNWASK